MENMHSFVRVKRVKGCLAQEGRHRLQDVTCYSTLVGILVDNSYMHTPGIHELVSLTSCWYPFTLLVEGDIVFCQRTQPNGSATGWTWPARS